MIAGQPTGAAVPAGARDRPGRELHVLFACVLFLLATSRWGSYLHVPGTPVFIGDIAVLAAVIHGFLLWRRGSLRLRNLAEAPRTGWLLGALLVWSVLRVVTRTSVPMVAVRDFAPYAYAIAAPLTFLLPQRRGEGLRRWVYAAFTAHAIWYLAATQGVVDPARTWRLAEGAPVFSTRPDFDGAIFGMAIAFAVHQIAFGPRPRGGRQVAAISAFVAVNALCLGQQHSRSGLLAAAIVVSAVVGAWLLRGRSRTASSRAVAVRSVVATVAVVGAVLALMFTVPGRRLVGGLDSGSQAGGTTHARRLVLEGISDWLLESPVLTTVGVGYGPNILARSETIRHLEGTEFTNVRSPHNYLVGTWARLGLIGALLAAALFVAAGRLGLLLLSRRTNPADVLAALVVITIPVVALFGVILESPFGAIPYFWAIGQLCASAGAERKRELLDSEQHVGVEVEGLPAG